MQATIPHIDLTSPASEHGSDDETRQEAEAVIDILYENQRGAWLWGLPLFSSASLLNFDPSAWRNAHGHTSPVNVTNAQLPDPSWKWAWPTWYVDMSLDVDEQGWQYSFMFRKDSAWHGTHPWFHSFVRRRRWIRKRVKAKKRPLADHTKGGEAHRLNADYFTIHAANADRMSTYATSTARTSSVARFNTREDVEELPENIENMPTLLRHLKVDKIDRERIKDVLEFIEQGGEDIHYLAEEMPHIMSLFTFQYSRQQLLSQMLKKMDQASDHRESHQKRDEEEGKVENQKIDNLLRAVAAAEKEVQQLQYWSDIRDMVQEGKTFSGVKEEAGWDPGWKGLDSSGANQAKAPSTDNDGQIQDEHSHDEHSQAEKSA